MKRQLFFLVILVVFGLTPVGYSLTAMLTETPVQKAATTTEPAPLIMYPEPPEGPLSEEQIEDYQRQLEEARRLQRALQRRMQQEVSVPEKAGLGLEAIVGIIGTANSIVMGWVMVFFHFRHKRRE